jgi:LacI family transcriptional regulator
MLEVPGARAFSPASPFESERLSHMISMKDVANHAGVSVGTVSNVINRPDRVGPGTRARVLAVIDQLGYVRSETARQLRVGSSRLMAVLVLDMASPFFVELARGAQATARTAGLRVMVCSSAHDPAEEAEYLAMFAEQRVRGVLITPAGTSASSLPLLERYRIPHVFADRVVPVGRACSVSVDDVLGAALAVEHLTSRGHTRIAFINGPPQLAQCQDRLKGARQAIEEAGQSPGGLRVLEVGQLDVASGRDAGARLLGLSERPTAVFCANDLLALGVLQALFAAGVRVPDDVALVGYDDIEFAAAAAVPLTSVRQPARRIGAAAAELLIGETGPDGADHKHQQITFSPELVARQSSVGGRSS